MSLQWATPLFTDGDFTVAKPVSLPVFSSPIPTDNTEYLFTQDWVQFRVNFSPTPLNTVHPSAGLTPDYSSFFLVNEGPREDIGGGIVRWKRTYGLVPHYYDSWEAYPAYFIGYQGLFLTVQVTLGLTSTSTVAIGGRARFSRNVTSRVRNDFFLVGPTGAGLATPNYSTAGGIPYRLQTQYLALATLGSYYYTTDFLNDTITIGGVTAGLSSPSASLYKRWASRAQTATWAGAVGSTYGDGTPFFVHYTGVNPWVSSNAPLWSSSGVYQTYDTVAVGAFGSGGLYSCILDVGPSGTSPSSDTTHWQPMGTVSVANPYWPPQNFFGGGAAPDGAYAPTQIVPEDARVTQWNGNIYLRQTRYVLAA